MPEEITNGQPVEVIEEPVVQLEGQEPTQGQEAPEAMSTSNEPTEVTPSEENELDPSVKDRTKEQFEKLKAEKAELKRQLAERSNIPSVLDYLPAQPSVPVGVRQKYEAPIVPQPAPLTPIQPVVPSQQASPLVDESGYVNTAVLKEQLAAASNAQKLAEEAKHRADEAERRVAQFEQDAQTKALYTSYPELDPMSEVFSKDAYDLVRNEITSQIINSGQRNAMKAASKLEKYFRKADSAPAVPQAVEQRSQVAVGTNAPRQPSNSLSDLKSRSMSSNLDVSSQAIAERMKRIGVFGQ